MYTTNEQLHAAANGLTDNIGGFISELVRLVFELLYTLIDCIMYAFDCIVSNPMLVLIIVFCFIYYVRRKYYVRK